VLFNSLGFLFVFLPVTYLVFWHLTGKTARYVWLAISGYAFYSFWNYKFCALMFFSTAVSYLAGVRLDLLVVLVPGKYAVYRPLVMNPKPVEPETGDYLERVERQLRAEGIAVINLTPVFAVAAARSLDRGEYLYWLEDTHWNARGIALASATVHQRWRLTDASCRASRPLVVETSHDESQQ
jgi:hypothetical protein